MNVSVALDTVVLSSFFVVSQKKGKKRNNI
jgi:hypothetical protein